MATLQVVRGLQIVRCALSWEHQEAGSGATSQEEGPTAHERKSLRLLAVRAASRFLGVAAASVSQVVKAWREAGAVEDLALLYSNLIDILNAGRVILMVRFGSMTLLHLASAYRCTCVSCHCSGPLIGS
jgi:hypothetical protein